MTITEHPLKERIFIGGLGELGSGLICVAILLTFCSEQQRASGCPSDFPSNTAQSLVRSCILLDMILCSCEQRLRESEC